MLVVLKELFIFHLNCVKIVVIHIERNTTEFKYYVVPENEKRRSVKCLEKLYIYIYYIDVSLCVNLYEVKEVWKENTNNKHIFICMYLKK